MDILGKIDKLRLKKNWSFYKLAEQSSLPVSTINNMYVRKSLPSLSTLIAICNGLGISLSQFFASDENDIINEQEKDLIEHFRNLSSQNKLTALKIVKILENAENQKIEDII